MLQRENETLRQELAQLQARMASHSQASASRQPTGRASHLLAGASTLDLSLQLRTLMH